MKTGWMKTGRMIFGCCTCLVFLFLHFAKKIWFRDNFHSASYFFVIENGYLWFPSGCLRWLCRVSRWCVTSVSLLAMCRRDDCYQSHQTVTSEHRHVLQDAPYLEKGVPLEHAKVCYKYILESSINKLVTVCYGFSYLR